VGYPSAKGEFEGMSDSVKMFLVVLLLILSRLNGLEMLSLRTFIFLIISVYWAEHTLAMDFKRLAPADGLSSSFVFSISQDRKGLIWIVTRAGIDSYDGSKFYHYELKPDSMSPQAQGRQVLYDANNNLWVGTTNGLFKYNEEKDSFELASDKFLNYQNFRVFKLQTDSMNRLWMGASNSLFVLNPVLDSLTRIPEINLTVNDILYLNSQYTIVATIRGIYKISTSDFSISPISDVRSINETFSDEFISSLHLDNSGRIWVAVLNKGLYIYDPVNEIVKHIASIQEYLEPGIVISNVELINNTEYLIATDGNGLLILNDDYSVKEHIIHVEDNTTSLSTNGVRDIFLDAENRIWVSTYGGGACLFDPYIQPFNRIEHIPNNINSVINNSGNAVIEDRFNRLWFGTKKGISVYFPDEKKWKHIYNTAYKPDILGQNNIKSFCMVFSG
jgi:ligand-binding sensor domain-containing protein